jgi:ATP-binding cassette subfamily B (MDR/TAP) protein 1
MGIIAPSIPNFIKAGSAAQQVLKLLNHNTSAENNEGSKVTPESLSWELKFQNIVFSYPKRETITILDGFCLEIPAGKVTAVVGPSGIGKSTIIGLLERWYTPSSGSVTLDGIDINELDLNWLRDHIGLVQQVGPLYQFSWHSSNFSGSHLV